MSQDSERGVAHPTAVNVDGRSRPSPAIDPAARASRRVYEGLSASSVGLELGLSVVLGVLFGMWLDGRFGTQPWLMLLFLVLGLVAGFRNVLRAVARADNADRADPADRADRTDRAGRTDRTETPRHG